MESGPSNPDAGLSAFKIRCIGVPSEFFTDKALSKKYFRRFGRVKSLMFKSKLKVCVVEYFNEDAMLNALELAGEYKGQTFSVSKDKPTKKKKSPSPKKKTVPDPEWMPDDEVRAELEAMGGTFPHNYNLRPEHMAVDEPAVRAETPKAVAKLNKQVKKVDSPKGQTPKKKTESDTTELENMIRQQAVTMEDKYRILDARDKLIRVKLKNLELPKTTTKGTCPDMCPEKERIMREVQHQVALYEQAEGGRGVMNPRLSVKQYSRSSADQEVPLPSELRPVAVLQMTMGYLMHKIIGLCENPDMNMGEWYHFLWDRTRGIRKDITQQELCCQGSVELVEQCARFHIFCSARLVSEDPSVFDQKINTENLTKCLQTLKYMYSDLRLKGESCKNEPEFRAYIILLNLNDGNFMWEVQQLKREIQESPEVRFALAVYSALDKNNYVKFFKLVKSTTYLNACILMRYFIQVRISALNTFLKCYSLRAAHSFLPLSDLNQILAFEDTESMVEFLESYGLYCNAERTHLILDKKSFSTPEYPYVLDRALKLVEAKRRSSVGEVVCGKGLPPKLYETHEPQDSFNEKGYLKLDDLGLFETSRARAPEIKKALFDAAPVPPQKSPFSEVPKPQTKNLLEQVTNKFFGPPQNEQGSKNFFRQPQIEQTSKGFFEQPQKSEQRNLFEQPQRGLFEQGDKARQPLWNTQSSKNIFGGTSSQFLATPHSKEAEIKKKEEELKRSQIALQERIKLDLEEKQKKIDEEKKRLLREVEEKRREAAKRKAEEDERKAEIARLEAQRREDLKRKEEAKALEAKRISEERARREAERVAQQVRAEREAAEAKKSIDIKRSVASLLDDLLNVIDANLKSERLEEIGSNFILRKFALKWRESIRRKRKRKAIEFSPVYYGRSVKDEAEELLTQSQRLALSNMKRYKIGKPVEIDFDETLKIETVDLAKLTYDILVKRSLELEQKIQKEFFWKITISVPDEFEFPHGLNHIDQTLEAALKWKNKYLIQQARHDCCVTYCVERQKGSLDSHKGDSNGLIFIANDFNEALSERILLNLKNYGVLVKTPIVLILQDYQENNALAKLVSEGIVSEYLVLIDTFHPDNLVNMVEEALVFLAGKLEKSPPLEINTLKEFLNMYLCNDIWKRAASFAKWNSNYKACIQNPNTIIYIYNEAVDRLKKVLLNRACGEYIKFPVVFKEFLQSEIPPALPTDYRYFPTFWNSPSYLEHVKKVLDTFHIPNIANWRTDCGEGVIYDYCLKVFEKDQEKCFYKVMAVLLDAKRFDGIGFIEVVAAEKLAQADFSLYGTGFVNKSIYNQLVVVYDPNTISEYTSDWFYINHPVVKRKILDLLADEKYQHENKRPVNSAQVNTALDKALKVIARKSPKFNARKLKEDLKHCHGLIDQLEDTIHIHRGILDKSGGILTSILKK